jgi:hypothetical protein
LIPSDVHHGLADQRVAARERVLALPCATCGVPISLHAAVTLTAGGRLAHERYL